MELLRKLFLPITAPIKFIQNHFKATVLVLIVLSLLNQGDPKDLQQPNLMEIKLFGPILGSEAFLESIEKAKQSHIQGVLLNVNSPGGAVAPSVEMMYAIRDLAKQKPVIAYASSTIASGSYYASIGATQIIANPGSIVGSIGVLFETRNFEKLLEKVGVEFEVIKRGEYKEAGTFYRDLSKDEREQLQRLADKTYDMFVEDVAFARDLNISDAPKFAEGKLFTSEEAQAIGLIDSLGTIDSAKTTLITLTGVSQPRWYKKDKLERLMDSLSKEVRTALESALTNQGSLLAY